MTLLTFILKGERIVLVRLKMAGVRKNEAILSDLSGFGNIFI